MTCSEEEGDTTSENGNHRYGAIKKYNHHTFHKPNEFSEMRLEEGISDLKKPYHPDFGYTQFVELDHKRPSWNLLAE